MCGIFAAINLGHKYQPDDYAEFTSLTDAVSYRGPDASGYLGLNSSNKLIDSSSFDIFLGHRRLSIIGLAPDGNQPMGDDSLFITYNGEIFNYIELRDELIKKGHSFRTHTDTEVILKTYREYGEEGFSRFNGMWSFVIVDTKLSRVVVSRDRFSMKPLFYTRQDNSIFFASEIKQLLPLLKQKTINNDVMFTFLKQDVVEYNNETFFNGIYKVSAKTNVIIDLISKNISEKAYWGYDCEEYSSESHAIEKFQELFYDSIRIRLRSDVRVGTLLSGGLDSSYITGIANNMSNGNIESFSVVYNDSKYSEERYVDMLVKSRNIKNTKIIFSQNDISLENINEVLFHQDEPFSGFSIIAAYNMFKKIKEESDVKVILSGQGADEILMGYLKYYFFYLKELVKSKDYYGAVKEVIASLAYRTIITQFKIRNAKRYIPGLISKKVDHILLQGNLEKVWEYSDLRQRQILDLDKYSIPELTHYEDRNSMAHSIESRLPFMDHRLVNHILNMPTHLKIKNGWTKYVLRKHVPDIPDQLRWRRDKQGFITPEEKWIRSDLKPMLLSIMETSILDKMGIIDKNRFIDYYHKYLNNDDKTIVCHDIVKIFFAELWAKRHWA